MKKVLVIAVVLVFFDLLSKTIAQPLETNYRKGFKIGFKEGYCYNNKNVDCFYPLTPLAPMPRINESEENYTQGYNRGFQFGLDLKRANQAVQSTDTDLENESVKFNDYISQWFGKF